MQSDTLFIISIQCMTMAIVIENTGLLLLSFVSLLFYAKLLRRENFHEVQAQKVIKEYETRNKNF